MKAIRSSKLTPFFIYADKYQELLDYSAGLIYCGEKVVDMNRDDLLVLVAQQAKSIHASVVRT